MISSFLLILKDETWLLPDSVVTAQRSESIGRKDQFHGAIYPQFLAALCGLFICVHDRFTSILDHSIIL
jgi:hypothetical protein